MKTAKINPLIIARIKRFAQNRNKQLQPIVLSDQVPEFQNFEKELKLAKVAVDSQNENSRE